MIARIAIAVTLGLWFTSWQAGPWVVLAVSAGIGAVLYLGAMALAYATWRDNPRDT